MLDKINKLPVTVQVILITVLLYCTWHFRFYTTGVNESELNKIEGVLYSFNCRENIKGADTIILYTSLLEREIWFEGWQKCTFLTDVMHYANTPQEVIFYTKLHKGIVNPDGALWVYSIDLKSTGNKLIYPKNGLGIKYKANFLIMVLPLIALILLQGLIQRLRAQKKSNNLDRL